MKTKPQPSLTRTVVAKKAGVGPETLRFYEQKGLLGQPARNDSGYRIYRHEDLARLEFIRRAQELGFSLQDIKQLLDLTGSISTPRKKVRDFAETRLEVIRRKIRHLQAMECTLAGLVQQCDGRGALKGCPIADFVSGHTKPTQGGPCHE